MITGIEKHCKQEHIIIGMIYDKKTTVFKKYFDENGNLKREQELSIFNTDIECTDLQDYFMTMIERKGYTEIR